MDCKDATKESFNECMEQESKIYKELYVCLTNGGLLDNDISLENDGLKIFADDKKYKLVLSEEADLSEDDDDTKRYGELYKALLKKVADEQEEYLAGIKNMSADAIISNAYEICYRGGIANIIRTSPLMLNENIVKKLLSHKWPVSAIYDKWIHSDGSVCDMLEDVIREYCKK